MYNMTSSCLVKTRSQKGSHQLCYICHLLIVYLLLISYLIAFKGRLQKLRVFVAL